VEENLCGRRGAVPLCRGADVASPLQGPYYCGVGYDVSFGRQICEEHLDVCLAAGLDVGGINGEVMPGQWEYQVSAL